MKKLIKKFSIIFGIIIGIILISGLVLIQSINDPHKCLNISDKFLKNEKITIAKYFTEKGLKNNTVANLIKVHGKKSEKRLRYQQNLEYGNLYSQYAWIHFITNEFDDAKTNIQKALIYKDSVNYIEPLDWIRYGLIFYEIGEKETGWEYIKNALIEDTNIEHKDSLINKSIFKIIEEKKDDLISVNMFLEKIRYDYADTIPNINLIIKDTIETNLIDCIDEYLVVIFFNPNCGSCRQELSSFDNLLKQIDFNPNILFILNQPETLTQAKDLFKDYKFKNPNIAILKNTNAYDLIWAEPTTWIINQKGKIIYKHIGFQSGDENKYLTEIKKINGS
jgi:thiol-disulfide isomerase/thioredoxin